MMEPKELHQNEQARAYWDVPLYAKNVEVRANRIDARIVDKKDKKVVLLDMSCPWVTNRELKNIEKSVKYAPLMHEIQQQMPGYIVERHDIVIDVLGGCSLDVRCSLTHALLGMT